MEPRLSIVVTSRNDDASGSGQRRMQIFVNALLEGCRRHSLNAELILVEWNPPPDRPYLAQLLEWPVDPGPCTVRIIQVPPEFHRRFKNSEVFPLFQMIAKNVGIRRARGKFVLATNVDILFSDELMQFLASEKLDPKRMYRVDRYDVPSDVPEELSVAAQLEWCRHHLIRIHRYMETVNVQNGIIPPPAPPVIPLRKQVMDWVRHRDPPLHTNACGDFTLLSKDNWFKVRAYPEFPLRAMKLDGLLCYAAHYAGARELVLKDPIRIYHMEHPARSDGALSALVERETQEKSEIQLSRVQYNAWVEQMRAKRRPIIFNDENWGLGNQKLVENIVVKSASTQQS